MAEGSLSAEIQAQLREECKSSYAHWVANSTPEMVAKGKAINEEMKNDPERAAAEMAKVATWFTESDANNDGRLDEAEYIVFSKKMVEDAITNGTASVGPEEGHHTRMFAIYDQIDPATPGVSMEEWMGGVGFLMQCMDELAAAQQ